jgi:hypothetical protein
VLCAVGRPLRLTTWLAVPFLFASAVLGLVALGGLLLGVTGPIALSSPLFGAGVAVGAAASSTVTWAASWQRRWLRWPYLASVLLLGVALDGVELPVSAAVCLGLPVTALLLAQYFVERRRTAELTEAGAGVPVTRC